MAVQLELERNQNSLVSFNALPQSMPMPLPQQQGVASAPVRVSSANSSFRLYSVKKVCQENLAKEIFPAGKENINIFDWGLGHPDADAGFTALIEKARNYFDSKNPLSGVFYYFFNGMLTLKSLSISESAMLSQDIAADTSFLVRFFSTTLPNFEHHPFQTVFAITGCLSFIQGVIELFKGSAAYARAKVLADAEGVNLAKVAFAKGVTKTFLGLFTFITLFLIAVTTIVEGTRFGWMETPLSMAQAVIGLIAVTLLTGLFVILTGVSTYNAVKQHSFAKELNKAADPSLFLRKKLMPTEQENRSLAELSPVLLLKEGIHLGTVGMKKSMAEAGMPPLKDDKEYERFLTTYYTSDRLRQEALAYRVSLVNLKHVAQLSRVTSTDLANRIAKAPSKVSLEEINRKVSKNIKINTSLAVISAISLLACILGLSIFAGLPTFTVALLFLISGVGYLVLNGYLFNDEGKTLEVAKDDNKILNTSILVCLAAAGVVVLFTALTGLAFVLDPFAFMGIIIGVWVLVTAIAKYRAKKAAAEFDREVPKVENFGSTVDKINKEKWLAEKKKRRIEEVFQKLESQDRDVAESYKFRRIFFAEEEAMRGAVENKIYKLQLAEKRRLFDLNRSLHALMLKKIA